MALTTIQLQQLGSLLIEEVNKRDNTDPGSGALFLGQFIIKSKADQKALVLQHLGAHKSLIQERRNNIEGQVLTQQSNLDTVLAQLTNAETQL